MKESCPPRSHAVHPSQFASGSVRLRIAMTAMRLQLEDGVR
jgi:hypothetical protein